VLAAPSQYMRSLLEQLKSLPRPDDLIYLNVAKGIEVGTCMRMSELVDEVLGRCATLFCRDRSHAEEVGRFIPTAVMTAAKDAAAARAIQQACNERVFPRIHFG